MKLLCITSHADTLNSIRPEAELFIGLQQRGVELSVMTQGDSLYRPALEAAGIRCIDFVPEKKLSLSAIGYIRRYLIEHKIDAVYSFNNKAIANTNLAAIGLPVTVVNYRGQTGNINRFDPAAYLTHLHPRVDLILCVANAVRDSVRKEHRHREKIQTVYKGHNLDWYQDTPADLSEFGLTQNDFVVGCIANNRPRKGLPSLIAATHYLPQNAPIHLLLIGGGLDDPAIQEAISASPLKDNIHIAGFRKNAPALIAACQASVLPSLKREGLPKTVIESMVYAVAPIVTDSGGNAELVEHEHSGLVVAPGDSKAIANSIHFLYEHPREAKRLGDNARARINQHFHVKQSIEQTYDFIHAAVARKQKP